MRSAFLSLGSNIGEREATLRQALEELLNIPDTRLTKISSFYETAPWGKTDQSFFVNAAVKIYTDLTPEELLAHTSNIEQKLGRVRHETWGERSIDIDILSIDGITMDTDTLKLPHPYMFKRRFVLVPLDEIAANELIDGKSINRHLMGCPDMGAVRKIMGSPRDFMMTLVACTDENGGLSLDDKLLFDIPEDKTLFRNLTVGNIIVMGLTTARTLPRQKPLPGRMNIVMSTTVDKLSGFTICPSLDELFRVLSENCRQKVFVVGGEQIYNLLMPYTHSAYVTVVHEQRTADTFLPKLEEHDFLLDTVTSETSSTGLSFDFRYYTK